MKDWCWITVLAKDVKPGHLISGTHATHPRIISRIEQNEDGTLTFWEDFLGKEMKYHGDVSPDHKYDLLVHHATSAPVTKEELF